MTLKHKVAYFYRWILFMIGATALVTQILPNNWYKLTYFTYLSNILVVLTLLFLVISMQRNLTKTWSNSSLLRWKALVTISISLTFLVFAFLLAPDYTPEEFYTFDNLTLHYVIPIGFILDWLFFDERGHYKKLDPLIWTILPIVYVVFALIKGFIFQIPIPNEPESPFPYFFLNVHDYGWPTVLAYILGIAVFYIALGMVFYTIKMFELKRQALPEKSSF